MSAPRRFAIICPNFFPRICGIGDHSARLGAELQHRGHEVIVLSRRPVKCHPEVPELEVRGVAGALPTTIVQGIAAAIEERRPTDVIIQYTSQMWNTWRFGSVALPLLAARARLVKAKVTLIAHELFVPWHARPDLWVAAVLQRLQFAALLKSCDHVFVTTDSRLRLAMPYGRALNLAEPGVVRVGANALPIPRGLRRQAPRPGQSGPRIGVFSTAAIGKRFDVVLDAFARIARERPSAQLTLIGDLGPPDRPVVRTIKDLLRSHPAGARIRVTGRLALSQVAQELAELDVYLFPMNTGANTRSGTLPAALGSGLPVVAVRGSETDADFFRDGENIVFARELSGPAFADAVLGLLRDPSRLALVAEGASRLYADHLSWQRIVDHLLDTI